MNDTLRAFQTLTANPYAEGRVNWFAKHTDPRASVGGQAFTAQGLEDVAKMSHHGFSCYVQLNPSPFSTKMRPTANEVRAWQWLLFDLDVPKSTTLSPTLLRHELADVERIAGEILGLPHLRSHRVFTGRGIQGWLPISPAVFILSEADHKRIQRAVSSFLKEIAARYEGSFGVFLDTSTSDLARLARLPGSFHTSTGMLSHFLDDDCIPIEPVVGVSDLILALCPQNSDFQELPALEGGDSWRSVFHLLTRTAQDTLIHGAPIGSRHRSFWHLITSLKELGVSRADAHEAGDIALQSTQKRNPADAEQLARDMLDIFRQVYKEG